MKLSSEIDVFSFPSSSHSFCLALYISAGLVHESEKERGYSHFFEHIVFRNINHLLGGALYKELDRHALTFSGTTYNELIQFSIQGNPRFLKKAVDIITLALSPLVISGEEFLSEKERVKREIREDSYPSSVDALSQKNVWCGTSLAESITGSVGKISKMSRTSLDRFRERLLTRENVFFYLTGSFTGEDEDYLAKRCKEIILPSGAKRENIAPVPVAFFKRNGAVNIKKADYCKVKISFDVDTRLVSKPVRDIIYDMLFQGDTSKIFLMLSEKHGYVYSFDANFEEYGNVGALTLSFETSEKDFIPALRLALELVKEPFDRETFEFAKVPYVENYLFVLDDAENLSWNKVYESHFLGFEYDSLEERREKYLEVTFDDVKRGAEEVFKRDNLNVSIKHRRSLSENEIKNIINSIF